jgi:hypothetical protein
VTIDIAITKLTCDAEAIVKLMRKLKTKEDKPCTYIKLPVGKLNAGGNEFTGEDDVYGKVARYRSFRCVYGLG